VSKIPRRLRADADGNGQLSGRPIYRQGVSAPAAAVIVQHAYKESGAGDVGLSPRGREQAEEVAKRLADLRIAAVYAGPLRRAREAASQSPASPGDRWVWTSDSASG
jgi:hypothetical protein